MTVTIRTLPAIIFSTADLRFVPSVVASQTEKRVTERATIGDEGHWLLSATSSPMGRNDLDRIDQVEVFAEFCASEDLFAAYDLSRQRPRAYASALTVGQGVISSISNSGKSVRVRDLQPDLILNRGALIEFRRSDNPLVRSLHRVATDVVASAAGTIEEVRLVHPVNTDVFGALDLAIVERPSTLMQIDSYSMPKQHDRVIFTFEASEVMFS